MPAPLVVVDIILVLAVIVGILYAMRRRAMKSCIRCGKPLTTKTLGACEPGVGPTHKHCGPNADLRQWEAKPCTL